MGAWNCKTRMVASCVRPAMHSCNHSAMATSIDWPIRPIGGRYPHHMILLLVVIPISGSYLIHMIFRPVGILPLAVGIHPVSYSRSPVGYNYRVEYPTDWIYAANGGISSRRSILYARYAARNRWEPPGGLSYGVDTRR